MRKEIVSQDVLVVGSGGREHALGWKLRQSKRVNKLYFAPGNGGTLSLGQNIDIEADDTDKLTAFAKDNNITTTIVGPEVPLAKGLVDQFNEDNLLIFGPDKKSAILEYSKAWAVNFMQRNNIPHPESLVFSDPLEAKAFLKSFFKEDSPYSFKWDGIVGKVDELAAGKGVELPETEKDAIEMVDRMMIKKAYGRQTGKKILIQEKLRGPEVSMLAFSDGTVVIPMLPARDYKRVNDSPLADRPEGEGLNTGGMASFAPVGLSLEIMQKIYDRILYPTIKGMREEDRPYKGVLYAGIMLTGRGPQVLEYNCRFGDPETQPLMMLLSSDLLKVANYCMDRTLRKDDVGFRKGAAVCKVLTSKGYPGNHEKGVEIKLQSIADPDIQIFHAGTKLEGGKLITNGGRVMGVAAVDGSVSEAFKKTDSVIGEDKGVYFEGMHYRKKFF